MRRGWRVLLSALAGVLLLGGVGGALAHSLFDPTTFRPLTADRKAFRVGDALTVQVVESASATVNADTASARRGGVSVDVAGAGGRPQGGLARVEGDFDGGGRTERAGRLLAQITVTVREVLPGGDLRVSGTQQLTINEETQRIALSGRVRPEDVSDGNVVSSTRLADPDITYVGEGHLADRQQRPWWRRLLDAMGL
jgi:flagellar L-ring protein precursor FlgH